MKLLGVYTVDFYWKSPMLSTGEPDVPLASSSYASSQLPTAYELRQSLNSLK